MLTRTVNALKVTKVVTLMRLLAVRPRLSVYVAVLLVLLQFLPGCWGGRGVEERSFIHIMGVDKGRNARLHVTVAIAVPRSLRQSPDGSPNGKTSVILDSEGNTIVDALNRLEAVSSREFTGQHITCLLLGEELAKDDVSPVVDVFHRSLEFRPTTLVVVCEGDAKDFIRGLRAPEEVDIADYLTKVIDTGYSSLGYCPVVTMHDFSERYQTSEASPWAPLLHLAAPTGQDEAEGPSEGQGDSELKPAAIAGTALFAQADGKYRMVGHLNAEETRAALIMWGRPRSWFLDIQSPGDEGLMSIAVRHASVKRKVVRQGEKVAVHFIIRLSGAIDEYLVDPLAPPTTDASRDAMAETAAQRVQQICRMSFEKMMRLGCDAIALGRSVRGTFRTMPEWEGFDWPSKLSAVTATFDVRFDIYSSGFAFHRAMPR